MKDLPTANTAGMITDLDLSVEGAADIVTIQEEQDGGYAGGNTGKGVYKDNTLVVFTY